MCIDNNRSCLCDDLHLRINHSAFANRYVAFKYHLSLTDTSRLVKSINHARIPTKYVHYKYSHLTCSGTPVVVVVVFIVTRSGCTECFCSLEFRGK
jgi:hypothetical protein